MNIEQSLKELIKTALLELNIEVSEEDIVIERSKDKNHGDYSTNVAMQLARALKQNPLSIAEKLQEHLTMPSLKKVEVVRPGFINFFMNKEALSGIIKKIITEDKNYGSSTIGEHENINVEFVSANPTGDLHLGHARGAALGDSICRIYEKAGFKVTREFYVNDAGNQIINLGKSLRARYLQLFGINADIPEDGYHAQDLIKLAEIMKNEVGDKYLTDSSEAENYFMRRGVELELDKLNQDLKDFRVDFDVFSFETKIRSLGGADKVLHEIKKYTYEDNGAMFLKTTDFIDDKDRVIVKSDGSYTYLLPDIAYHLDKLSRGYTKLIDVLGADHHGYINRMKSALMMFNYRQDILEIELIQMVRLFKDNQEYKMSKRSGNAVSLRELCQEVGVDAVRYFFVSRAGSAHLDFDLDLALERSSANPVYYAQYAHARLCTVLKSGSDIEIDENGEHLGHQCEIDLLKHLVDYQKVIEDASISRSPYKLTIYIQKLASLIHSFYTECRLLDHENIMLTKSRLGLAKASAIVIKNALELIGVEAPEQM